MGREEPGGSHPIINQWEGAWMAPVPGKRVVPGLGHGQSEM
jgi:hypothetical protein